MDFLELAKNRFSVLDYTQQKVNKELIDKILDAGLAAPTACNKQPQKILIIDDEEGKLVLSNEDRINELTDLYRRNQIHRLKEGSINAVDCIIYSQIMTDIERISDHMKNIIQERQKYPIN